MSANQERLLEHSCLLHRISRELSRSASRPFRLRSFAQFKVAHGKSAVTVAVHSEPRLPTEGPTWCDRKAKFKSESLAGSAVTGRGPRETLAAPVAEIRDVTFISPRSCRQGPNELLS